MVLSEAITYVTGKRAKHRVEFRRTFPVESREVLSQSFQSGRCEVASIEILLDRHKMTVRMGSNHYLDHGTMAKVPLSRNTGFAPEETDPPDSTTVRGISKTENSCAPR